MDNIAKNFKLQPNNGFEIKTWTGDIFDTHLLDFDNMLTGMSNNFKDDIRNMVKSVKMQVSEKKLGPPCYKKVVIN